MIIICSICVIILLFGVLLYRKRQSYYPYSPACDYEYKMIADETYSLPIIKGRLELPPHWDETYTIFARIHISTSLSGYFWHPSIKIQTKSRNFRQYTEYGSKGYRYINLSHICKNGERTLLLKGHRLYIKDQDVEIIAFKDIELTDKKILIIAPHPDDAEIAAYGLYETHAENVFILTISPGENGYFKYKELYKPAERTQQHLKKGILRTWNSLTVPLLAGVKPEHLLQLGYFNETLEEMYKSPDKEIPSKKFHTTDTNIFRKQNTNPLVHKLEKGSNWKALVKNIGIVLDEFNPDIIISPHPYIDEHEDHQYATIALFEAIVNQHYTKGHLFLHTNHFLHYPYGRIGSIMTLPPIMNDSVAFNRLQSIPLSADQQRNKILAFDAMNDLRLNTDYRSWRRLLARGVTALRSKYLSIEKDYFNLYIRSNELFFIVPASYIFDHEKRAQLLHGKHHNQQ